MEMLRLENLSKYFPIGRRLAVRAVNGVNLSIAQGETLGLVGESGCGKTTVGRCSVRLLEPTGGKIFLMGNEVTRMPETRFKKLRPRVQIVFQEPYGALNPRKVVRQIVEDPLIREGQLGKGERLIRVKRAMDMVGLSYDRLDKYPIQLTQGEQQRVGISRALVTDPNVVILDEPTSLLDICFRSEIVALLRRLQQALGVAYLFISHDLVVIGQLSHRIAVMYLGRIVEEGPTEALFRSPMHPYTRALFAATLFPDPDRKRGKLALKGEVPSPVNLPDDRCNFAPRCLLARDNCLGSLPRLEEIKDGHLVACFYAGQ